MGRERATSKLVTRRLARRATPLLDECFTARILEKYMLIKIAIKIIGHIFIHQINIIIKKMFKEVQPSFL